MSGHDKLTILLTLKGRAEFTQRWMTYAEQARFPFKVLIADGSLDETAEQLLSDRSRFPHVNYEYRRYPCDLDYRAYYEKIDDALSRVRTPYVSMADNDDFLVVSMLERAVAFLDEHAGYSACGGQCAQFWIVPDATRGGDVLYGHRVDWKTATLVRSNESASALERLRLQSNSGADPLYYDVKRTQEARRQFSLVRRLELSDLFLVEFVVHFLTLIAGRTKRFDQPFLARQHNSPGGSGSEHQRRFGDWLGRMMIETWSADFAKFLDAVAEALALADGLDRREARDHVLEIYRQLVAPALLSDLLQEPTVTPAMLSVLPAVRRLVSLPESSLLKRAFRRLYRSVPWISLDAVHGTEMLARPIPDAAQDYVRIREFLASGPPQIATNSESAGYAPKTLISGT